MSSAQYSTGNANTLPIFVKVTTSKTPLKYSKSARALAPLAPVRGSNTGSPVCGASGAGVNADATARANALTRDFLQAAATG